jgi:hypothetical protein
MTLGNVWSFPSATLTYDQTLAAMKALAVKFAGLAECCGDSGDPIELSHVLEPQYPEAAKSVPVGGPVEGTPIPALATLVVASPFDAAIHDAFGKLLGLSCYRTYGPEFTAHDLGRYLDSRFAGEYLDQYVSEAPKPRLYVYHPVGALDPLTDADLQTRIGDGLPETLEDRVLAEGVDHIKIKLDGSNLGWDVNRVLSVDRVLEQLEPGADWRYSLDFNERCRNAEYVLDCFGRIRDGGKRGNFVASMCSRVRSCSSTASRSFWLSRSYCC